jgi:hypothetical protein
VDAVLFRRGCCTFFNCGGCIAPPWVLFCSIVGAVLFSPGCITVQSWVHPFSRGCCMYCAIMGAVHCSLVDAHTAQSWVLSFSFAGVVILLFSHGNCAVQCRVQCCSVSGAVLFSVGCCTACSIAWVFVLLFICNAVEVKSQLYTERTYKFVTVMYEKLGHDAVFLNHGRSSTASLFK